MAKKGGTFLGMLVAGAAAAAGTYYYLQKKNETKAAIDDDAEDINNMDLEAEEDEETKRSYTSLTFSDVEKKVQDVAVKFAGTAEKVVSEAGVKLQTAAGKIEEFFDDRKVADDASEEEEDDIPSDAEIEDAIEETEEQE